MYAFIFLWEFALEINEVVVGVKMLEPREGQVSVLFLILTTRKQLNSTGAQAGEAPNQSQLRHFLINVSSVAMFSFGPFIAVQPLERESLRLRLSLLL